MALVAWAPQSARAADADRRVAVLGPASDALAARLEAELAVLDFEVVRTEPGAGEPPLGRALASVLDVSAIIEVEPASVTVWVGNPGDEKTQVFRIERTTLDDLEPIRVTAVRIIDRMETAMNRVQRPLQRPQVQRPLPGTSPNHARPKPKARALTRSLALGPAITYAPGGATPSGQLALTFSWHARRWIGVGARMFVPFAAARVRQAEGQARLYPTSITLGPRIFFMPTSARVQASMGISLGPLFVPMRGSAAAPFRGDSDWVVTGLVELDATLSIPIHRHLRILVSPSIGSSLPRVGVRFGGRRVATWGLPVVSLPVALAVAW
jgi:hypothetical protein